MSYDLRIWSIDPCPAAEAHRRDGRGWIINVSSSDPVLGEDIDDDVLPLLPGIRYLTHLHLEGARPPAARAALAKAAKAIAAAARGAIQDPQEDSVTLPSGVKRWVAPARDAESVSLVELSWWMEHSLVDRELLASLLRALDAHLPEALPRRYGEYEPPAHQLARTSRDHLLDFLVEHLTTGVVCYPHPPVASFSLATRRSAGGWITHGARRKFRCHHVSIAIERDVLTQPGWATGLDRAWRALSVELRPFYGDVRTTHGHGRSQNGRWWSNAATENHPIKSWWFGGVPARMGHAVVVGAPYLRAWPALARHGTAAGQLRFLSTPDWLTAADLADTLGGVPAPHLLDERTQYPETYPPAFPFPDV